MSDITSNANGFMTCSYSLTALPLQPYIKLSGFSPEGVDWETISVSTTTIGADGLSVVNQKPVTYVMTFKLLANSPCRNILDSLINSLTPVFGKSLNTAEIVLTETNNLTNKKVVYSGGSFTEADGGNKNNMDNGQEPKTYKITFTKQVILPL